MATYSSESKQAAEALAHANECLRLATRAGGVGLWDYDVPNNRLIWDPQMHSLYGITPDQFDNAYEAWLPCSSNGCPKGRFTRPNNWACLGARAPVFSARRPPGHPLPAVSSGAYGSPSACVWSSVFCLLSSVFCLLSSVFCLKVFRLVFPNNF